MQITFRERWLDRRLAYQDIGQANSPKFLTVPHVKNNVWIPDSFFPVTLASHFISSRFLPFDRDS